MGILASLPSCIRYRRTISRRISRWISADIPLFHVHKYGPLAIFNQPVQLLISLPETRFASHHILQHGADPNAKFPGALSPLDGEYGSFSPWEVFVKQWRADPHFNDTARIFLEYHADPIFVNERDFSAEICQLVGLKTKKRPKLGMENRDDNKQSVNRLDLKSSGMSILQERNPSISRTMEQNSDVSGTEDRKSGIKRFTALFRPGKKLWL
ncbi:hypothetical protein CC78DRAFT_113251 [Lojkania enalia]|uniref:Uncharacterized protein n=1 Tax=Lojkania enalia TaxID=147567 RepID=A0A9P4K1N6_9PLEO|nr:hypothetical protein CC78DRAFT_113251 [Didymosphaeria enalia]